MALSQLKTKAKTESFDNWFWWIPAKGLFSTQIFSNMFQRDFWKRRLTRFFRSLGGRSEVGIEPASVNVSPSPKSRSAWQRSWTGSNWKWTTKPVWSWTRAVWPFSILTKFSSNSPKEKIEWPYKTPSFSSSPKCLTPDLWKKFYHLMVYCSAL